MTKDEETRMNISCMVWTNIIGGDTCNSNKYGACPFIKHDFIARDFKRRCYVFEGIMNNNDKLPICKQFSKGEYD